MKTNWWCSWPRLGRSHLEITIRSNRDGKSLLNLASNLGHTVSPIRVKVTCLSNMILWFCSEAFSITRQGGAWHQDGSSEGRQSWMKWPVLEVGLLMGWISTTVNTQWIGTWMNPGVDTRVALENLYRGIKGIILAFVPGSLMYVLYVHVSKRTESKLSSTCPRIFHGFSITS